MKLHTAWKEVAKAKALEKDLHSSNLAASKTSKVENKLAQSGLGKSESSSFVHVSGFVDQAASPMSGAPEGNTRPLTDPSYSASMLKCDFSGRASNVAPDRRSLMANH